MNGIFEIAITGAWVSLMVISMVRVVTERRRWRREHPMRPV